MGNKILEFLALKNVKSWYRPAAITALLMMLVNITRTFIILSEPYSLLELSELEHADYLKRLVSEWNKAPIVSMWLSDEPCFEPAFERTWHGTLAYTHGKCDRDVKGKCARRPEQDAYQPVQGSTFLDNKHICVQRSYFSSMRGNMVIR